MNRFTTLSAIMLSAMFGLFGSTFAKADDSTLKVKVGDAFPNVELEAVQLEKINKDAKKFKIEDYKKKAVVIFFYPKALTGG